jgi:hypothetical protein
MIGGSLFYDFARVGATPAPFQSFVSSAGVVTDYVYGAGMHWQGGCGGFPCDGSGRNGVERLLEVVADVEDTRLGRRFAAGR